MPLGHARALTPRRRAVTALPGAALAAALVVTMAVSTAAAIPAGAASVIYSWVDADGVVHYAEVAPRDRPYREVVPGGPRPEPSLARPARRRDAREEPGQPEQPEQEEAGPRSGQARSSDPEASRRRQREQLDAEQSRRLAAIEQVRRENCERAREQFEEFTTYARIRVRGEDGEFRVLSEQERQQRIEEAKAAIVANCDPDQG